MEKWKQNVRRKTPTLSIYTPGKINQVSEEKKDHTQVKNDSSELFTVLILYDSNM